MDARVDVVVDVDHAAGNVLQQKVVLQQQKNHPFLTDQLPTN